MHADRSCTGRRLLALSVTILSLGLVTQLLWMCPRRAGATDLDGGWARWLCTTLGAAGDRRLQSLATDGIGPTLTALTVTERSGADTVLRRPAAPHARTSVSLVAAAPCVWRLPARRAWCLQTVTLLCDTAYCPNGVSRTITIASSDESTLTVSPTSVTFDGVYASTTRFRNLTITPLNAASSGGAATASVTFTPDTSVSIDSVEVTVEEAGPSSPSPPDPDSDRPLPPLPFSSRPPETVAHMLGLYPCTDTRPMHTDLFVHVHMLNAHALQQHGTR